MLSQRKLILLIILWLFPALLFSHEKEGKPTRTMTAVRVNPEIKLDGLLNETFWKKAVPARDFIQSNPDQGKTPTESTTVYIAYDDQNLYVGAMMYDSEPNKIVKRLTRRDRDSQSDKIGVGIDSYHDHQTGYAFFVNAAGVQQDWYLYDDTDSDEDWDAVWEVKTQILPEGWSAEFKIPFSILRFPRKDSYEWGVTFERYLARKNENSTWVYVPEDESGDVSRFGHLNGLSGFYPKTHLEILPYLASQERTEQRSPGNTDGRDFLSNSGLDIKYGISSNLILDATVNPDFGQVEADQVVLNLSRYETFFPEKRPFFLEGTGIFATPFTAFYSRRIGRPPTGRPDSVEYYFNRPQNTTILLASKITGKTASGTSIGILEALTQKEETDFWHTSGFRTSQTVEPQANYGVVRLKQDFLKNSALGMIATSVTQKDRTSAYTGGLDWSLKFSNNKYTTFGQVLATRNGPASSSGLGLTAGFDLKAGKHINASTGLEYESKNFNINRLGYIGRPNWLGGWDWIQYRTKEDFWVIRDTYNNFNFWWGENTDGVRLSRGFNFNNSINLKNNWWFGGGWEHGFSVFDDLETFGGPLVKKPAADYFWMWVESDYRKRLAASIQYNVGDNRDGTNRSWYWSFSLKPRSNLQIELVPSYSVSKDVTRFVSSVIDTSGQTDYIFGGLSSTDLSLTLRTTVTFTTKLTLQTYGQIFSAAGDYKNFKKQINPGEYQGVSDDILGYSPDFNFQAFNSNVILRWEYRSGSTLYVVWTQGRNSDSQVGDFRFGRDTKNLFDTIPNNLFLVKVSYWYHL